MTANILPLHPAATWADARAAYSRMEQMGWQSVQQAMLVGDMLIELKAGCRQRSGEPSFHQRVKTEIPSMSHNTRAKFMRLALHRTQIEQHQPESLAKALMLIAGQPSKAKREKKPKSFRIGWINLLVERLGLTHGSLRDRKAEIEKALGVVPKYFTDYAAAEAFVLAYVAAFPSAPAKVPELSDTAQQKLGRAIAIKAAELDRDFNKRVYAEVDRRMPEFVAEREQFMKDNEEETARYRMLNDGIKKAITAEDYRFLIQVVHPDKNPPEYKERYERAFRIVRQLQDYVEALEARHARR